MILAFVLALAGAPRSEAAADTPPEWENPQLVGLNNQPPHASMVICPDAETALKIGVVDNANRIKSPLVLMDDPVAMELVAMPDMGL